MCEKIMLHNFYGIREIWMFVSNIRFRNIMINWIIKNYVMFLLTKMVFSCCVCCKDILGKRIPYHDSMLNLGIKIATNSCYIYIYIYQCIFHSINMLFAETTSSISKHLNIQSQIKPSLVRNWVMVPSKLILKWSASWQRSQLHIHNIYTPAIA